MDGNDAAGDGANLILPPDPVSARPGRYRQVVVAAQFSLFRSRVNSPPVLAFGTKKVRVPSVRKNWCGPAGMCPCSGVVGVGWGWGKR